MDAFERSRRILARIGVQDFRPHPFFSSGFAQTVAGAYWPQRRDAGKSEIARVDLGGGDATLVVIDRPPDWMAGEPVALLIHGLSGDHLSTYMVRMSRKLNDRGYLCVRMNLRNAGAAFGMSRKTYHAGITEDVRSLVSWIKTKFVGSSIAGMGFSLGGNLLLKAASEDGSSCQFSRLVVVSPAVDLARAASKLEKPPGSWISQIFLRQLVKDVERLQVLYPDLEKLKLPKKMTIRQFDEIHISKFHGFKGADDYYSRCSSGPHLDKIEVPTLIIGAVDDPVVDVSSLLVRTLPEPVEVIITEQGGHVGYLGVRSQRRWADDVSLAWLK